MVVRVICLLLSALLINWAAASPDPTSLSKSLHVEMRVPVGSPAYDPSIKGDEAVAADSPSYSDVRGEDPEFLQFLEDLFSDEKLDGYSRFDLKSDKKIDVDIDIDINVDLDYDLDFDLDNYYGYGGARPGSGSGDSRGTFNDDYGYVGDGHDEEYRRLQYGG